MLLLICLSCSCRQGQVPYYALRFCCSGQVRFSPVLPESENSARQVLSANGFFRLCMALNINQVAAVLLLAIRQTKWQAPGNWSLPCIQGKRLRNYPECCCCMRRVSPAKARSYFTLPGILRGSVMRDLITSWIDPPV